MYISLISSLLIDYELPEGRDHVYLVTPGPHTYQCMLCTQQMLNNSCGVAFVMGLGDHSFQ